ncbi:ATP-binding protein [Pseudoalteromonas sp. SCSIO 43210]
MAKFKPRARLIRSIGDKLISGPVAAILELVKNSYDADAEQVDIKIEPGKYKKEALEYGGKITIKDNGHGMSLDDITGIWLEPATDIKSKNSKSRSGKRSVLGAKGVGRFATSRIGHTVELTSLAEVNGNLQKSRLFINWEIFEQANYLEDIDIIVEDLEVLDSDISPGLTIEVKNLKDIWDKTQISDLIQELRRLAKHDKYCIDSFNIKLDLSSFKLSEERAKYLKLKNKKSKEVDFSPYDFDGAELFDQCNRTLDSLLDDEELSDKDQFIINPYTLGEHSDYYVKGSFDSDGHFTGYYQIVRGDNEKKDITLEAPSYKINETSCGVTEVTLKLFDLEPESLKRLFTQMGLNTNSFSVKEKREFIAQNTGIGIYRNNFRVRPYGHHDHDWLNLEKRRVQNPSFRVGHGQIGGEVIIQDEAQSSLVERSSREGLEENGSFKRLKRLLNELLKHIEAERHTFREKAGISRKPKKDFDSAFEIAKFNKVNAAIDSIANLSKEDKKAIQAEVSKTSNEMEKVLTGMKEYLQLLETRAALGNVVAELLHEGRAYLSSINETKEFLNQFGSYFIEDNELGDIARTDLPNALQVLDGGTQGITKLFKDIDPISGRKRGKPSFFNVLEVIENTQRLTNYIRKENDVVLEISCPDDIFCYGFNADLQAALMNVIINAAHWLGIIELADKVITVQARVEANKVILIIENNGPIINEMHHEKLFEAGFSLKTHGHGLGLVIAREAIRNSDGDMYFDKEAEMTKFVIEFPSVSKESSNEKN